MCAKLGPGAGRDAVSEYNGHEGHWRDVTNGQNDRIQPNPFRHSQLSESNFYPLNQSVTVSTLRNNTPGKHSGYLRQTLEVLL